MSKVQQKLKMERWVGKVAVVTGASSGIGAAIAKDLAKAGLIVIGLARRTERVEELKDELKLVKGELYAYYCDVSDLKSIREAFKWIESKFKVVNIIVNNAGLSSNTKKLLGVEDNLDDLAYIINVNLTGTVACTQEAFRLMKKNNVPAGHIVNISSIMGHKIPYFGKGANLNTYPSSKHGVTALSEVIRQELVSLDNKNIRVTNISPGIVRTEIMFKGISPDQMPVPFLEAEDVSNSVLYAIAAPAHVQIHEITIKPVGESF